MSRHQFTPRLPRMGWCLLLAVILLAAVALVSPQQLPVILYKFSLVTVAGVGGYWLDRWAFPYGRPDFFLFRTPVGKGETLRSPLRLLPSRLTRIPFAAANIRRAIIMGAAMLAVGMGL
jgi:hypothetical protein